MESIDLMMEDFHDNYDDDEAEEFPPLPPMPSLSPTRDDDDDTGGVVSQALGNDGNAESDLVQAALEDLPAARVGRTVNRKPQPKLDATRLTNGERGIGTLPKHFGKLKFKGKGHETADLKTLMQAYEHWAHRLFPKMPFDDVIEKIEQLGSKKPVQVYMKKLRMDMPLTDEDYIGGGAEDEDNVLRGDDESTDLVAMAARSSSQSISQTQIQNEVFQPSQHLSSPPPNTTLISSQQTPRIESSQKTTQQGSLSEEQIERIERNKRIAREKREARLRAMENSTSSQHIQASQHNSDVSIGTMETQETDDDATDKRKEKSDAVEEIKSNIDDDTCVEMEVEEPVTRLETPYQTKQKDEDVILDSCDKKDEGVAKTKLSDDDKDKSTMIEDAQKDMEIDCDDTNETGNQMRDNSEIDTVKKDTLNTMSETADSGIVEKDTLSEMAGSDAIDTGHLADDEDTHHDNNE